MNGYVYNPRPSAYARAHTVLLAAQHNLGAPLAKQYAEKQLKATPGLMFAPGVTLGDVLTTLEKWRLLQVQGEDLRVLPC